MGIPGLSSFMANRKVFRDHKLHDTKIVIDGNNLMGHLFGQSNCNPVFGADNDIFASHLRTYFNSLLDCNIEPLVIFDGGIPFKKEETIQSRYKKKINDVAKFCQNKNLKYEHMSPLVKDVFKQVLRDLKICFAQAIFEADENVAAIAKLFDCPVLSFDSDFFIYDVQIIHMFKIKPGVVTGEDFCYKSCQIYKAEYFLDSFPNLDKSTLPLLAALLGTDYSDSGIFTGFINRIKPPSYNLNENDNTNSCEKIELILNWLRGKDVNSAVNEILHLIDPENQEKALEIIQFVYTAFEEIPIDVLTALGYSEKLIKTQLDHLQKKNKPHKFIPGVSGPCKDLEFLNKVPGWFKQELYAGLYQGMTINYFTDQTCSLGAPIQDLNLPCPYTITFPIMKLVQCLVTKGILEFKPFKFVDRRMKTIVIGTLECEDVIPFEKLPTIFELRNLQFEERKKIIDKALGLTGMDLVEIDGPWKLFVGIIVFWLKANVQPMRNKFHAYAIVFSMIQSVVEEKVGYYRDWKKFEVDHGTRYKKLVQNLGPKKWSGTGQKGGLVEALKKVSTDDCIVAAKFFITKGNVDWEIQKNPRNLDVTVLHVYNMLQNCVRDFANLNDLLGGIYENPNLKKMMRGVLFYNLYNSFKSFKSHSEIDLYVEHVLSGSPSLLRVFQILIGQVKSMWRKARFELFL